MKINDTIKSNTGISATSTPAAGAKSTEKAASAAPATTDSVRLSSQGQAMAAGAVSGGNQVFDTKKVERIKMAIAEGHFTVNSEKVAEGLLDTVRDLLHSRGR